MSHQEEHLSHLYQQGSAELPPSALDDRIRKVARKTIQHKANPMAWMWPVASAATVVLGVGLLVQLSPEALHEPVPSYAEEQPMPVGVQKKHAPLLDSPAEAEQMMSVSPSAKPATAQLIKTETLNQSTPKAPPRRMLKPPSQMLEQDPKADHLQPKPAFSAPTFKQNATRLIPTSVDGWLKTLEHAPPGHWLQAIDSLRKQGKEAEARRLKDIMNQRFDTNSLQF